MRQNNSLFQPGLPLPGSKGLENGSPPKTFYFAFHHSFGQTANSKVVFNHLVYLVMKSMNYILVTAFLNKPISKSILLSLNVSEKGS